MSLKFTIEQLSKFVEFFVRRIKEKMPFKEMGKKFFVVQRELKFTAEELSIFFFVFFVRRIKEKKPFTKMSYTNINLYNCLPIFFLLLYLL